MADSLQHRLRAAEWMDEPNADPRLLRKSLVFIQRVNHWLGYTRATIDHLEEFSHGWTRGQTIRLLDVATGSADVPRAILKWADHHGFDVQIVGVDLHATTAHQAADARDPRLTIMRANAMELPFADQSFDYALTSMFLHHLDEPQIVRVLREMDRVSRRGILAADLLRDPMAVFWIKLFTLFANPMVRHDAIVSVQQALRREEIEALAREAGVDYARYHRHFGHRFVLAGERGLNT